MLTIKDFRRIHRRIRRDMRQVIAVHRRAERRYLVKRLSSNSNKVPTAARSSISVPAPIEIHSKKT